MKLNQLIFVGEAIENISHVCQIDATTIIEALVGTCWDEEETFELKQYLENATH